MPHAVAAALLTGDAGARAFDARALNEPSIAALRGRVVTAAWTPALPPPNDRPARVAVRLHDGNSFEAECLSARGGPDRPLPPDVWIEKMRALAVPVYPGIVSVLEAIVRGDAQRLEQPWSTLVKEITGHE